MTVDIEEDEDLSPQSSPDYGLSEATVDDTSWQSGSWHTNYWTGSDTRWSRQWSSESPSEHYSWDEKAQISESQKLSLSLSRHSKLATSPSDGMSDSTMDDYDSSSTSWRTSDWWRGTTGSDGWARGSAWHDRGAEWRAKTDWFGLRWPCDGWKRRNDWECNYQAPAVSSDSLGATASQDPIEFLRSSIYMWLLQMLQPYPDALHEWLQGLGVPPIGKSIASSSTTHVEENVADVHDIGIRVDDFGQWLEAVDPSGSLLVYRCPLEDCFDSVSQIIRAYSYDACESSDDDETGFDDLFFEDIGIADPSHQQLFTSWFLNNGRRPSVAQHFFIGDKSSNDSPRNSLEKASLPESLASSNSSVASSPRSICRDVYVNESSSPIVGKILDSPESHSSVTHGAIDLPCNFSDTSETLPPLDLLCPVSCLRHSQDADISVLDTSVDQSDNILSLDMRVRIRTALEIAFISGDISKAIKAVEETICKERSCNDWEDCLDPAAISGICRFAAYRKASQMLDAGDAVDNQQLDVTPDGPSWRSSTLAPPPGLSPDRSLHDPSHEMFAEQWQLASSEQSDPIISDLFGSAAASNAAIDDGESEKARILSGDEDHVVEQGIRSGTTNAVSAIQQPSKLPTQAQKTKCRKLLSERRLEQRHPALDSSNSGVRLQSIAEERVDLTEIPDSWEDVVVEDVGTTSENARTTAAAVPLTNELSYDSAKSADSMDAAADVRRRWGAQAPDTSPNETPKKFSSHSKRHSGPKPDGHESTTGKEADICEHNRSSSVGASISAGLANGIAESQFSVSSQPVLSNKSCTGPSNEQSVAEQNGAWDKWRGAQGQQSTTSNDEHTAASSPGDDRRPLFAAAKPGLVKVLRRPEPSPGPEATKVPEDSPSSLEKTSKKPNKKEEARSATTSTNGGGSGGSELPSKDQKHKEMPKLLAGVTDKLPRKGTAKEEKLSSGRLPKAVAATVRVSWQPATQEEPPRLGWSIDVKAWRDAANAVK